MPDACRKPEGNAMGRKTAGPLRVGIIGLAHLHPRQYVPLFKRCKLTDLVAFSEASGSLRDAFASDFGVKPYAGWRDMIGREKPDLVYIFLPHCDCAEAAIACAGMGINVVVEKPVAHTAESARSIARACRDHGVLFSTPYVWRYHPVCRRMKQEIDRGTLGRIVGCEGRCAAGGLHRYTQGHSEWMLVRARSGGGPMYNLGVHWIDLYRWLLGSEVVEVMGRNVHINTDHDIEDNSFAILTFASGATLALDISYTVPDSYPFGRDLYLGIRGTEGCINFTPSFEGLHQKMFLCSNRPPPGMGMTQTIPFELEDVAGYTGAMGLEYVTETAERVLSGTSPFIGADDAVKALDVVEAVYRSAQEGRAVRLENTKGA
jgi:predicted dehydrogenase